MKKIIKEDLWFYISLIIIIILFKIKLPYYIDRPGGTIEINNRIECKSCHKINGSLNLMYVTENEATIPTFLASFLIPNWDLEKISEQQINNETTEEIFKRNKLMLEESIDSAIMVAYKESNNDINITSKKNIVLTTTINNNLKIGDEILEVDGRKIDNILDIKKIINEKEKNDKLNIKVKRNNQEKQVTVTIREEKKVKLIGAVITTDYDYNLDPSIKIKFKQNEAGASGGLMLALSIYSKISKEDIIKGRKIAGTGTINFDGTVGQIDGIKYKIIGAHKNNIDIVLVPKENYKEALKVKKKNKYKMKIVKVEKFSDAIKYLKR